jgi:hypothetical protein
MNKLLHLLTFIAFHIISSSIAQISITSSQKCLLGHGFVNCITLYLVSNMMIYSIPT